MTAAPFCALCTDDTRPLVERSLGPGEPTIRICSDCDTLHPRSGRYAFDDSAASERAEGGAQYGNGGHKRNERGRGVLK